MGVVGVVWYLVGEGEQYGRVADWCQWVSLSQGQEHMTILNPVIRHEQIPSKRFIIEIKADVIGDIGQHTSIIYQLLRKLPAIAVFTLISPFNVVEGVGGDVLVSNVKVIAVNADNILIALLEAGGVFIKGEQFLDAVHKFLGVGAFHMCDILGVGEGEQYLTPAEECQGGLV